MDRKSVLIGVAAGSTLMYVLDPKGGRRRRAMVRDQVARASRKTRDGLSATARDMSHRASGIVAAARGRLSCDQTDDDTLVARVRSRLGRASAHPRAIEVRSQNGDITLRGQILRGEREDVVASVKRVRGVRSVHDELEPHDAAEGVPSLQGDARVAGSSFDATPGRWAPTTRALVGAGLLATGVLVAMNARSSHEWEGHHAAM
jgi:BON domain-containing protein